MAVEPGVGVPRLREPAFGARHGSRPRAATRASSGHHHHAQERKAAQVPGPRCLLGLSDRGRLCQLESGSVRSGRVRKALANIVHQEVKYLCGLEASQVPAEEAFSGVGEPCDILDSSDEMDAQKENTQERSVSRKKKSKRHKDLDGAGEEYPMDIWLLLASYIRPEDIVIFFPDL